MLLTLYLRVIRQDKKLIPRPAYHCLVNAYLIGYIVLKLPVVIDRGAAQKCLIHCQLQKVSHGKLSDHYHVTRLSPREFYIDPSGIFLSKRPAVVRAYHHIFIPDILQEI